MAGYTDFPMRDLCFGFGCSLAVTEMISCRSVVMGIDKPAVTDLLARHPSEKSLAVQLFGSEPEDFASAV
jgi:tRNA-dihydrouridine synthase